MFSNEDLLVYQGDDWAGTVMVTNEDGTPADIDGYTAKAQIRRAVADQEPEVAVEITTVVESPLINLSIPHTETVDLQGRYVWDLQIVSPTGGITTIVAGKVKLTPEVTRNGAS